MSAQLGPFRVQETAHNAFLVSTPAGASGFMAYHSNRGDAQLQADNMNAAYKLGRDDLVAELRAMCDRSGS